MSLEGKTPEEINALAQIADSVMSDPKTRLPFQRILKQANPRLSVPEVEIEDRISAATKPLQDELEQRRARDATQEAQAAANALYQTLRDDRVVKGRADFNDLVKYAADKGFQTTESGLRMASSHRASEQQAAEPTPQQIGTVNLGDRETHKDLLKDPTGWARREAAKAIDDLNKGKKAA